MPQVAITESARDDRIGRHDLLAGHRIDAAIGQRRRHHREVARRDQDGALPEIHVEHRVEVAWITPRVAQEIGDRPVAVAGRPLGGDRPRSSTSSSRPAKRPSVADAFEAAGALGLDQAGAGDRPGIDHRIERPVVAGEPDRIEGVAGGLDADRFPDPLRAPVSSASANTNGLEIDWMVKASAVADFVDMAVE